MELIDSTQKKAYLRRQHSVGRESGQETLYWKKQTNTNTYVKDGQIKNKKDSCPKIGRENLFVY